MFLPCDWPTPRFTVKETLSPPFIASRLYARNTATNINHLVLLHPSKSLFPSRRFQRKDHCNTRAIDSRTVEQLHLIKAKLDCWREKNSADVSTCGGSWCIYPLEARGVDVPMAPANLRATVLFLLVSRIMGHPRELLVDEEEPAKVASSPVDDEDDPREEAPCHMEYQVTVRSLKSSTNLSIAGDEEGDRDLHQAGAQREGLRRRELLAPSAPRVHAQLWGADLRGCLEVDAPNLEIYPDPAVAGNSIAMEVFGRRLGSFKFVDPIRVRSTRARSLATESRLGPPNRRDGFVNVPPPATMFNLVADFLR
ncbi:hypothetical protein GEV33_001030 [Tenebrio molitor]|uniref:Uncharacterized protein n=1 Tax=Tenebrio molitor TaxID=7067 RepID=A0A8J6HTU5_TENMO|nr:hypothetical protein GEV33_001030 [Tenebrio molitor]